MKPYIEEVLELSDKDNEFITTSTSEGAGLIKEKIFETIVAKETDKSAEIFLNLNLFQI